jgi:23S rRNA (adenine2503-C2)-methyltransferase
VKVLARAGREEVAFVYLSETDGGRLIEFAESGRPGDGKWVLCVSTLYGCPVECRMCDAGGSYQGKLSADEILAQIDYMVRRRFPDEKVQTEKFKIQFARMGEPAFNPAVLDALEVLPDRYQAPGLMPSFSTIAPEGMDQFFTRLLDIKQRRYSGKFQFQFSLHTTDLEKRNWLIPAKTWSFEKMARYGQSFRGSGERKITLNFALAEEMPVDATILRRHFDPQDFLIKITPVNPTFKANGNNLNSVLPQQTDHPAFAALREAGYQVILSIGDLRENGVGSNCGQYVRGYRTSVQKPAGAYEQEFATV